MAVDLLVVEICGRTGHEIVSRDVPPAVFSLLCG